MEQTSPKESHLYHFAAKRSSPEGSASQASEGSNGVDLHHEITQAVQQAIATHNASWQAALQKQELFWEKQKIDALHNLQRGFEETLGAEREKWESERRGSDESKESAVRKAQNEAMRARQDVLTARTDATRLQEALDKSNSESVPIAVHRSALLGKDLQVQAREIAQRDALRSAKLSYEAAVSRAHSLVQHSEERFMVQMAHKEAEWKEALEKVREQAKVQGATDLALRDEETRKFSSRLSDLESALTAEKAAHEVTQLSLREIKAKVKRTLRRASSAGLVDQPASLPSPATPGSPPSPGKVSWQQTLRTLRMQSAKSSSSSPSTATASGGPADGTLQASGTSSITPVLPPGPEAETELMRLATMEPLSDAGAGLSGGVELEPETNEVLRPAKRESMQLGDAETSPRPKLSLDDNESATGLSSGLSGARSQLQSTGNGVGEVDAMDQLQAQISMSRVELDVQHQLLHEAAAEADVTRSALDAANSELLTLRPSLVQSEHERGQAHAALAQAHSATERANLKMNELSDALSYATDCLEGVRSQLSERDAALAESHAAEAECREKVFALRRHLAHAVCAMVRHADVPNPDFVTPTIGWLGDVLSDGLGRAMLVAESVKVKIDALLVSTQGNSAPQLPSVSASLNNAAPAIEGDASASSTDVASVSVTDADLAFAYATVKQLQLQAVQDVINALVPLSGVGTGKAGEEIDHVVEDAPLLHASAALDAVQTLLSHSESIAALAEKDLIEAGGASETVANAPAGSIELALSSFKSAAAHTQESAVAVDKEKVAPTFDVITRELAVRYSGILAMLTLQDPVLLAPASHGHTGHVSLRPASVAARCGLDFLSHLCKHAPLAKPAVDVLHTALDAYLRADLVEAERVAVKARALQELLSDLPRAATGTNSPAEGQGALLPEGLTHMSADVVGQLLATVESLRDAVIAAEHRHSTALASAMLHRDAAAAAVSSALSSVAQRDAALNKVQEGAVVELSRIETALVKMQDVLKDIDDVECRVVQIQCARREEQDTFSSLRAQWQTGAANLLRCSRTLEAQLAALQRFEVARAPYVAMSAAAGGSASSGSPRKSMAGIASRMISNARAASQWAKGAEGAEVAVEPSLAPSPVPVKLAVTSSAPGLQAVVSLVAPTPPVPVEAIEANVAAARLGMEEARELATIAKEDDATVIARALAVAGAVATSRSGLGALPSGYQSLSASYAYSAYLHSSLPGAAPGSPIGRSPFAGNGSTLVSPPSMSASALPRSPRFVRPPPTVPQAGN